MRLMLTVVTDHGNRDVLVDGDEMTTVADLAEALSGSTTDPSTTADLSNVVRLVRARAPYGLDRTGDAAVPRRGSWDSWPPSPGPGRRRLWLDGRPLDPDALVFGLLRDGDVVALDPKSAAATVTEEPAGVVEVRVVGGPAAGAVHRLGLGVYTIGSDPAAAIVVRDPAMPPLGAVLRITPGGITVEPPPPGLGHPYDRGHDLGDHDPDPLLPRYDDVHGPHPAPAYDGRRHPDDALARADGPGGSRHDGWGHEDAATRRPVRRAPRARPRTRGTNVRGTNATGIPGDRYGGHGVGPESVLGDPLGGGDGRGPAAPHEAIRPRSPADAWPEHDARREHDTRREHDAWRERDGRARGSRRPEGRDRGEQAGPRRREGGGRERRGPEGAGRGTRRRDVRGDTAPRRRGGEDAPEADGRRRRWGRRRRKPVEQDAAVWEDPSAPELDGTRLTEPEPWGDGRLLRCGDSLFACGAVEPPDAHLDTLPDGGLAYNRPPRLAPAERVKRFEVPAEPKRTDGMRLQLLAALLPAVFGLVMALVFQLWYFLLIALMTPAIMIGQWWSDRRHGRKKHREAMKAYRRRLAEFEEDVEIARAVDEAERRAAAPDPAELLLTAKGPRRRLWERRIHDPDVLRLRLGLADLPADLEFVPERGASDVKLPDPPIARNVPVNLAMRRLGVAGLTGSRPTVTAVTRWLIGQAATLHSPRDLAIVVLSAKADGAEQWSWVRWLPHCGPRGSDCAALVGADPEAAAKRVAELASLVAERLDENGPYGRTARGTGLGAGPGGWDTPQWAGGSGTTATGPAFAAYSDQPYDVLLILDGAQVLRALPGMPQVLRQGPRVGVYTLALDDDRRLLPEECATVVSCSADGHVRLHGGGLDALGPILADQVSTWWAEQLARSLAPLRDVSRGDPSAALPSSARFLDLIGLPAPNGEAVRAKWTGATTRALIGVGPEGPFTVDLRRDGPHGLIAGTTGAGKSELLQTLICALAVVNRPDEMTFVLIDYKGGAAFKECVRLPHTVGMVSDLDGHLTQRALESLAAEIRRRERLLLAAGAKDIEDYQELRAKNPGMEPLPRLVLIIDEFAALVAELPDFVEGLVDIARRGRSLGIHLILATQRPQGVVTADIQANTSLRIALRVTDTTESSDVIDGPEAAHISKSLPGRCYVKSGAEAAVAVQAARVGGRAPGGEEQGKTRVVDLSWQALGHPVRIAGDKREDAEETDLSLLVDAIRDAAQAAGIPAQQSPWLPPLPDNVVLGRTPELALRPATRPDQEVPPLPFGVTDLPWAQTRRPLVLDLAHGGHLLIAGTSRTGRSTALRTIAGSILANASPADVHVHAIDCGSGALLPLVAMPHCGAVVTRDQIDRVERLLTRLRAEVARRQRILAEAGYASLAEARAAALAATTRHTADPAESPGSTRPRSTSLMSANLATAEGAELAATTRHTADPAESPGSARPRSTSLMSASLAATEGAELADTPLIDASLVTESMSQTPLGGSRPAAEPPRGRVEHIPRMERIPKGAENVAENVTAGVGHIPAGFGDGEGADAVPGGRPVERMPWLVLMLDRWEGFVAAFEQYDYGRLIEALLQLLREGPAVGLRAVVTSDRSGLLGQISTVFDDKLVLRLADATDYGLAGLPVKNLPSSMPPGRALAPAEHGLVESQIALLCPDPAGPAQVAELQALARASAARWGPNPTPPLRVDALPMRITASQVRELVPDFRPPSPLWALLGAGGDALAPLGIDLLAQGPGAVVAGPARSGRSSALVTAARSLLAQDTPVLIVTPRRSPLRELAGTPGVLAVLDANGKPLDGSPEEPIPTLVTAHPRYVVLVDDAELISPDTPLGMALEEILRTGRDEEHGLLIAGTTGDLTTAYRGFVAESRKSRTGLLLSVQSPADGDLFAIRLPRGAVGGPTGRGLLIISGTATPIQAAVPP